MTDLELFRFGINRMPDDIQKNMTVGELRLSMFSGANNGNNDDKAIGSAFNEILNGLEHENKITGKTTIKKIDECFGGILIMISEIEEQMERATFKTLKNEGFNPKHWRIKEIPIDDQLMTFQNLNDDTEFTIIRESDGTINPYYTTIKNGCGTDNKAKSIIEAIELSDWNGRGFRE